MDIFAGNKNGNLCLGRVRLILAKIIMDIHSTIMQGTNLEQAPPSIPGLSCDLPGIAKEDESKADNLFISFEKNVNQYEEKTGSVKNKKTEPPAEANGPVS